MLVKNSIDWLVSIKSKNLPNINANQQAQESDDLERDAVVSN
jgi:hypothetical protein